MICKDIGASVISLKSDVPELDDHLTTCKKNCAGCCLAKNYRHWRRHLSDIPWLAFKTHRDGTIGVGCILCSFSEAKGACGLFELQRSQLKLTKLERHQLTECHKKAWARASEATGLPGPPVTDSCKDAPPVEVFQAALKRRLEGLACQSGIPDHGVGADKCRQLSFCLAEAKRMMVRNWILERSVTIALQQDERHQRLLLRFTAASGELERKSGVIGLAKNFGSAAGSIAKATERIIRQFCTPGSMIPGGPAQELPVHQGLLQAFRQKTEVFVADNAGDEQKASELLRHKILAEDGTPFLANLRLGFRDSAHASRRIIKRPFEADPALSDIMNSVFFGAHSIVAAIENSILLKNRLEHHCSKCSNLPSVRSLSLAKQRFDSTQKPIGRFVLYFVPFLTTVIELSRESRGDLNGMRASAFLAYCSEEVLLQIAMIADAGDEGGQLVRALDKELPASEELASTLSSFQMKIACLFGDEPVCLSTGYTHHMILTLQEREYVLPTLDGRGVRTLGGPGSITAQMVEQCLRRMRGWVQLANAVIAHEFPEWDLITCFQIFNVTAERATVTNQTRDSHVRRLAKFFSVDLVQFRAQLDDLSAIARVYCQNSSCTSLAAWQHTIKEVLRCPKRRAQHPCHIVQPVLARWAGWTSSSCGVEQSFGHSTHFSTARQSHASEASECNDMTLMLDHDEAAEGEQIRLAMQVWVATTLKRNRKRIALLESHTGFVFKSSK